VKVVSSGISELPLANNCRARSRVLYNLSLTSPRITRYGSLGGICFQNSGATNNLLTLNTIYLTKGSILNESTSLRTTTLV